MSNITSRIRVLRQQYQAVLTKAQTAEELAKKQLQATAKEYAASLLDKVYQELSMEVCTHCGLQDYVVLYPLSHELRFTNDELTTAIQQIFQDQCGLHISKCKDNYKAVMLHLTSTAKTCSIVRNGKTIQLDFPTLVAINAKRRLDWQENLPDIAKRLVDICKDCIESLPNKHYGIPHTLPIRSYAEKTTSRDLGLIPFIGTIHLYGLDIHYDKLSSCQTNQLTTQMNRLIAHGDITFEKHFVSHTTQILSVSITKNPKKHLDQPYYDYATFYDPYDKVTPELQKVFDTVAANVSFPPASKQFASLTPQRKMIYQSTTNDDVDLELLSQTNPCEHNTGFQNTLHQRYPGLQVTNIEFVKRDSSGRRNQRVEFLVDIDPDTTDPTLIRQLQIEHAIHYIKKRRIQYIANQLAQQILDDFETYQCGMACLETTYPHFAKHSQFDPIAIPLDKRTLKHLPTAIIADGDTLTIDLKKIGDYDFLKRVKQAVSRQTSGVINIDIQQRKYIFHLS